MAETLCVHSYSWEIKDVKTRDENINIHCWALDQKSNPYLMLIKDFPFVMYLALPRFVRGDQPHDWTETDVRILSQELGTALRDDAPYFAKLVKREKLFYFRHNRKYPMIWVGFRNMMNVRACVKLLENPFKSQKFGYLKLETYENDISIVRKLLTERNVRYSQWMRVPGYKVPEEDKISTIENEYLIEWNQMEPVSEEESSTWTTLPGVLAIDGEMYSHNHRAMPNCYLTQDVCYMLSCIYQRYNRPETRERFGIIIGDCNNIPPERLANCTIYKVKNEIELVDKFADIVREKDPEVIAGYNILSYDFPFLDTRVQQQLYSFPAMSRIVNAPTEMKSLAWASSGYQQNSYCIPIIPGRICIDMLPVVRRDHKMDVYNLEAVSRKFLKKGKHDVKPVEMFEIYEELMKSPVGHPNHEAAVARMTTVMEYCIQDSELVIELMEALNIWTSLVELSNIVGISIVDGFTRGQQIRCISQIYDIATKNGIVIDRRYDDVPTYSGGYVEEPIPGLYENVICLDFASLYPSIMMAYNICYTTLLAPELMSDNDIDYDGYNIIDVDDDVTTDKKNVDDLTIDKEAADVDSDDENEDPDTGKKPVTNKLNVKRRFLYTRSKEGLLPRLVRQLVDERNRVREQLSKSKDPIVKNVLNARQLALKTSANSFYGFLGFADGKIPLVEGAMSITAKGRELIKSVGKYLHDKYNAKIVYGDTDSCMVDLNIKDRKECQYWGVKLSQEISGVKAGDKKPDAKSDDDVYTEDIPGLFPPPLRMEFEKAMRLLCFKKKKYAALMIDKKGNFKLNDDGSHYILTKGIVLARRDNNKALRRIYSHILNLILDKKPMVQAVDYLVDYVTDIYADKYPAQDFVTVRQLGANYKSPSYFMKVFADRLTKLGKIVSPGDRLGYVIIEDPNARLVGEKMFLFEDFETTPGIKIDYNYFVEKMLSNPINQLFEVGYKNEIVKHADLKYRRTSRCKDIGLEKIVNMIYFMKNNGIRYSVIKDVIRQRYEEENKPKIAIKIVR